MEFIASALYKTLSTLGFEHVEYHAEESLGHSVSSTEIKKLREYLRTTMV